MTSPLFFRPLLAVTAMMLLLPIFILAGCASNDALTTDQPIPKIQQISPPVVPVIRYGRYTLVELTPEDAQRDLMAQVIDVSIPLSIGTNQVSVGDAMRYVLERSGYRLCNTASIFDALPLPVAHSHLGPLTLRNALTTLAGPTWTLHVNQSIREVCFVAPTQSPKNYTDKKESTQ